MAKRSLAAAAAEPTIAFRTASRWGLAAVGAAQERAARVERLWRWPLVWALLATIPAFYAELLDAAPPLLANLCYALAATVVAAALWHTGWRSRARHAHWRANPLEVVLVLGLLVAAVLPASASSVLALCVRLAVAGLTLVRLVWAVQSWLTRGGLAYLLLLALALLCLCGAGFWWLEPRAHTLADGLWLAFTTAATVGYGDIVPSTPASKIFSVFVVLFGYGVLSLVTAAIATSWIETEERRMERTILRDLRQQLDRVHAELAALREDVQREHAPRPD